MIEKENNPFESEPEHIPTPEEVRSVFSELIGKEYSEKRKLEDEKGLYTLEVEALGDLEGEVNEYAYMRKGCYPEGAITVTEIHVTYYVNGAPISGTSAAPYVEGKWKIL